VGDAFLWAGLAFKSPAFGIASTIISVFWFILLFMAAMPASDQKFSLYTASFTKAARITLGMLIFIAISEIVIVSSLSSGLFSITTVGFRNGLNTLDRLGAYSDAAALEHQATENFLAGENPYKESNVITAGIKFDLPYSKLTPLRVGQFANDFPYPDLDKISRVYDEAKSNPQQIPVEFVSAYNYPAGSFIIPAPFIAPGIPDIRIVFLLCLLPALGYVIWQIKTREMKIFFGIVLFASFDLWNSVVSGATSLLVFPMLLLSWILYRKNLWVSALFMALAIATKQVIWFFLPFYLILILREKGFRKSFLVAALCAAVFLLFNGAYIINDPKLWFSSIVEPMANTLFPSNIGIITLNFMGIINAHSSLPFTIMEIIVYVASLMWYYFNCKKAPETGIVLAITPFFFAWRGSWGYYLYYDILIMASILLLSDKTKLKDPALELIDSVPLNKIDP
jgi:hypothetical protein